MNPRQQTLAFADEAPTRVHGTVRPLVGRLLSGPDRAEAIETIKANHYTHSVPSGKSHYVAFESALVVWSIPANKNIARCGPACRRGVAAGTGPSWVSLGEPIGSLDQEETT